MPRLQNRGYTLFMQDFSEVPTDTDSHTQRSADWQSGYISTLLCIACGSQFEASVQQPRLRCPFCETVGYPDRAGRNLVSTAWECLECGANNPETTNFCLECSAGLTSRCLRCESPVYTSICHNCGSQQDKLLRMQTIAQERAEWMPLQRSVLDAEQRKLESEQAKLEKKQSRARMQSRPEAEPSPPPLLEAEPVPQISKQSLYRRSTPLAGRTHGLR
jgi:hypothetical protein